MLQNVKPLYSKRFGLFQMRGCTKSKKRVDNAKTESFDCVVWDGRKMVKSPKKAEENVGVKARTDLLHAFLAEIK